MILLLIDNAKFYELGSNIKKCTTCTVESQKIEDGPFEKKKVTVAVVSNVYTGQVLTLAKISFNINWFYHDPELFCKTSQPHGLGSFF